MKPLNALLLGAQYAESLGFNTQRIRNYLLVVTGLLSAITTAFCGPIGFIGLAVPHIARLLLTTENHRLLLPSTILSGALIALFVQSYLLFAWRRWYYSTKCSNTFNRCTCGDLCAYEVERIVTQ